MLNDIREQVEALEGDLRQLGEQLQGVKRLRWPVAAACGTELEGVRKKLSRLKAVLAKASNGRAES